MRATPPTSSRYSCNNALIRASVPERVAMLLTGHKSRAIFDRYNIINEQELLDAGDQLVEYLAQHAQTTPRGRAHPTGAAQSRPHRHGGHRTGIGVDEDHAGLIDATVERPPVTPAAATVVRSRPRTCPDEGQTRAVEHEMEALAGRDRSQTAPQQPHNRLLSAR